MIPCLSTGGRAWPRSVRSAAEAYPTWPGKAAAFCAACVVFFAGLVPHTAALAGQRLSREETVELFAKLSEAAKTAKSLQAKVRIAEESSFLLDAEPVVNEGRIWVVRPGRFRKEVLNRAEPGSKAPRSKAGKLKLKSLLVVGEKDLWLYFPALREVQHADIRKALSQPDKGKSKDKVGSFMPWLSFDLVEIEKKYRVRARTDDVPEGVTIRDAGGVKDGEGAPDAEAPHNVHNVKKAYRIDYVPRDAETMPNVRSIKLWVDGEHPWPLRIEKRTRSSTITTEMRELVVDAELDEELFEFKPPKGTKVEELTE